MEPEVQVGAMPQPSDPIHRLLEWEQEARRLVDEAEAQARTIRDEASRRRRERLEHAQHEARTAAERRHRQVLDEAEPRCRVVLDEAERTATRLRAAALPRVDEAVYAALRWLLFEEVEDVRRRPIR